MAFTLRHYRCRNAARFVLLSALAIGASSMAIAQEPSAPLRDAESVADTAQPVTKREGLARFLDPEDKKVDLSYILENPRGFLPIPILITEPAVGYGGGGVEMFLRPRKEAGDEGWARPDISAVGAFATQTQRERRFRAVSAGPDRLAPAHEQGDAGRPGQLRVVVRGRPILPQAVRHAAWRACHALPGRPDGVGGSRSALAVIRTMECRRLRRRRHNQDKPRCVVSHSECRQRRRRLSLRTGPQVRIARGNGRGAQSGNHGGVFPGWQRMVPAMIRDLIDDGVMWRDRAIAQAAAKRLVRAETRSAASLGTTPRICARHSPRVLPDAARDPRRLAPPTQCARHRRHRR